MSVRFDTSCRALSLKAPSRLAKAGTMTFCSTVRSGKISGVWNTRTTPIWLISCGSLAGEHLAVEDHGPGVGREPADEDIEQGRLAGAVRPDDGVGRAFLDLQVDVGQRMEAAEVLVHVGDVEDDVRRASWSAYSAGWVAAAACLAALGGRPVEQCARCGAALHDAAGQEDHDEHEDQAERQVPAIADEQRQEGDDRLLDGIGQEAEEAVQRRSLKAEKMFSKYLISQAPITGPTSVPTPPRMVISTTSPEAVHCMRSAPASGSVDGQQPAGQPGIHAGDDEGGEQIGPGVEAGVAHAVLVGLDRPQHHAEGRAEDAQGDEEADDQQRRAEIEARIAAAADVDGEQVDPRQAGLRRRRTAHR